MSSQYFKDENEIRKNYETLVYTYNAMKFNANEKIRTLQTELKKSNGQVEHTNQR